MSERDGLHAQQSATPSAGSEGWDDLVLAALKRNDVKLVTYVPDRVLTPLIAKIHADPFFTAFATTREEEAIGIIAGAWMGGMRGTLLMQTSGFATLANVLASLVVPSQIPAIMFVSERGTLGEFNLGQALVCRTMRPVLDSTRRMRQEVLPSRRMSPFILSTAKSSSTVPILLPSGSTTTE